MHGNAFHLFPRPGERGDIVEWLRPPFPRFFPPVTALPPSFTRPLRTDPYVRIDRYVSNNLAIILVNPRIAHTFILQGRNVNDERERFVHHFPTDSIIYPYFFFPSSRSSLPFSLYRFLLLVSRNAIQRGVFDNDNTVTRATGSRYASTSNRKW